MGISEMDFSEHLKDIRALGSLEQLYLVSFVHIATSFKRAAVVSAAVWGHGLESVCAPLCLLSMCDVWFLHMHIPVSKYYFVLFIFVIPCCAFQPDI